MADRLTELLELLELEQIEENIFRGQSQDLGWGRVYGGQVVGQALSAAEQTVSDERSVHSMHGYFLRPGDASKPIVYMVDPIRDGRSFATRRVVAVQNGKAIFNMSASFQITEPGMEHQDAMPEAPGPDGLLSEEDYVQEHIDLIPGMLRDQASAQRPFEVRLVSPRHPIHPEKSEPHRQVWFRTARPLSVPAGVHQYLLAYASDSHFMTTSLQPHGKSWLTPGLQVASLDHAMWFHRPVRVDEWLLYDVHSPSASGARGVVQGRLFDQKGRLVATTAQEGLIRDRS